MSEEQKVLTKEIAEQYLKESWSVSLNEFTSADPEAIGILCKNEGWLNLSGLRSISSEIAQSLAEHRGDLRLDGLKEISDEAAASLERHQGGLSLRGLRSISESVANSLASSQGRVDLSGLSSLTDASARALLRTQNPLFLDGLEAVSEEAAALLAKNPARISLKGLRYLTDSANNIALASKLATQTGEMELTLKSLRDLSPDSASALAEFKGRLLLDGLAELSQQAAEALSKHEGWLSLDGLASLSDEAATALSKHAVGISLGGLTEISDAAASSLAGSKGAISLRGLTKLSPQLAEILATHKGYIDLDGVTEIDEEVAKALSKHEGPLYLNGLKSLSETAAAALAERNGLLLLSGDAADAYANQCAKKLRKFATLLSSQDDSRLNATLGSEFQPGDGQSIGEAIVSPQLAYEAEFLESSKTPPKKWPPCWLFQCQSGSRESGASITEGGEMYLLEFLQLFAQTGKPSAVASLLETAKQLGIKSVRPRGTLYFFESFNAKDANISDDDVAAAERGESPDLFADGLGNRGGVYRACARSLDYGLALDALSFEAFRPKCLLATNGPLVSEEEEPIGDIAESDLTDGADILSVEEFGDRPRDCTYVVEYEVDKTFQGIA
jgi:hypothetical protein